MKLFTKYNRVNIITSICIFIGGCIAFYFTLYFVLVKQLDETLETEKTEVLHYSSKYNRIPETINTDDQLVFFTELSSPLTTEKYFSKVTWNENEKENELMRHLEFGITIAGKYYKVSILKSQEETQGLLKMIVMIAAVMIGLILIAGYTINRVVLKKLWQPFYQSITEIKNYNLQTQKTLQLPSTAIEEFNLLNGSLNDMTSRVETDYRSLKEFTGNAAHEMQTPLAVIAANTESIIQDQQVLKDHHQSISAIEQAAKRLSRLNQSLLLLTKIENELFQLTEKVQWEELIQNKLADVKEMISEKQLSIDFNHIPVATTFHQHLAEILISNLLRNAIRYNIDNGSIKIDLDKTKLTISNTSDIPSLDQTKIFNRFYRHPKSKTEGNGLGLSIVHQICKLAGYKLRYQYINQQHVFLIEF